MSTQAKKVQLKYGNLLGNSNFRGAIQKLLASPMEMKQGYAIKRVFDKLDQTTRSIRGALTDFRKEAAEKFAKRNEDGTMFVPEGAEAVDGQMPFTPDEKHFEAMMAAEKEFADKTVELDYPQVHFSALGNTKFSPIELVALEGIIDFDGINEDGLNAVMDVPPENVTELKKA